MHYLSWLHFKPTKKTIYIHLENKLHVFEHILDSTVCLPMLKENCADAAGATNRVTTEEEDTDAFTQSCTVAEKLPVTLPAKHILWLQACHTETSTYFAKFGGFKEDKVRLIDLSSTLCWFSWEISERTSMNYIPALLILMQVSLI